MLQWLLKGGDVQKVCLRKDCGWTVRGLIAAALLWAWSDELALTRRFASACKIAARLVPKRVPRKVSYQAFLKLLDRWTVPLTLALTSTLRGRMRTSL